jgi:hypothetical protein
MLPPADAYRPPYTNRIHQMVVISIALNQLEELSVRPMAQDNAARDAYSEITPELDFRAATSGKVAARFLFGQFFASNGPFGAVFASKTTVSVYLSVIMNTDLISS